MPGILPCCYPYIAPCYRVQFQVYLELFRWDPDLSSWQAEPECVVTIPFDGMLCPSPENRCLYQYYDPRQGAAETLADGEAFIDRVELFGAKFGNVDAPNGRLSFTIAGRWCIAGDLPYGANAIMPCPGGTFFYLIPNVAGAGSFVVLGYPDRLPRGATALTLPDVVVEANGWLNCPSGMFFWGAVHARMTVTGITITEGTDCVAGCPAPSGKYCYTHKTAACTTSGWDAQIAGTQCLTEAEYADSGGHAVDQWWESPAGTWNVVRKGATCDESGDCHGEREVPPPEVARCAFDCYVRYWMGPASTGGWGPVAPFEGHIDIEVCGSACDGWTWAPGICAVMACVPHGDPAPSETPSYHPTQGEIDACQPNHCTCHKGDCCFDETSVAYCTIVVPSPQVGPLVPGTYLAVALPYKSCAVWGTDPPTATAGMVGTYVETYEVSYTGSAWVASITKHQCSSRSGGPGVMIYYWIPQQTVTKTMTSNSCSSGSDGAGSSAGGGGPCTWNGTECVPA